MHHQWTMAGQSTASFSWLVKEFLPYLQVQDYKEGTPDEKTYYIELWDVGGSVGSASSVKSTRAVFYNSVNGKDERFVNLLRKVRITKLLSLSFA